MTDLILIGVCVAFVGLLCWLARRIRPAPRRRHSELYETYMRSPAWRARRAHIMRRARQRCEARGWFGRRCSRPAEQVHHLHYQNLGHEPDRDLQALCKPHHDWADRVREAQARRGWV